MVFLLPQTEVGDHESNAKPSAYVIFSCTVQQLWSMSGKKKEGWWIDPRLGFCQVCMAGGQGKERIEGANGRER